MTHPTLALRAVEVFRDQAPVDEHLCSVCGRESCEGHGDDGPVPRTWQTADEAIAEPVPDPIVEGVLWPNCVTVLVAESGAGKTFVALSLAAHVAAGLDWHGRRTTQGSVAYLQFEGTARLRLRALRDVGGFRLANLYVVDAREPISPVVDRDRLELPSRGEQWLTDTLTTLATDLASSGKPPVVAVILDTIRASLAGSEDSSDNVSAYLRAVRRLLSAVPGAGCLLIHHAGWQDGEQKRKRERGSSSIRGNVDGTLYLEAGEYDRDAGTAALTVSTLKTRDDEPPVPLRLVRRRVDLPGLISRWGEPVTSCVIEWDRTTHDDRERTEAAAADAADRTLDLKVLRIVADRPELATSPVHLRQAVGRSRPRVAESVARLLAAGWLLPPSAQRRPYTVTPAGLDALQGASS